MSISLPDEMKAEMDEMGDRNWSGLAQRAFADEIARVEWRRKQIEEIDMDEVIERLRESKAAGDKSSEQDGFKQGVQWAKAQAPYEELKRVAECGGPVYWPSTDMAWILAGIAVGDDKLEREGVEEWWCGELPSDGFVIGFYEGASSVWAEVVDFF
ncbi:MAG: hypothetical protein QGF53_01110 [Alphaproteobacteria bacterium]|jgi:hypothetical protein|nr:hypothetical protein [Alphaproteobacteria bacterium]